jgi:hypothetical protein
MPLQLKLNQNNFLRGKESKQSKQENRQSLTIPAMTQYANSFAENTTEMHRIPICRKTMQR